MPQRTHAAVIAVLLLALTGCSAAETPVESALETPAVQVETPSAETPAETAPPLVAETPGAQANTSEEEFVQMVRDSLLPQTQIPNATDEQLIAAGYAACERIAAGEPTDLMSVIEGETREENGYFYDSTMIITSARVFLCAA